MKMGWLDKIMEISGRGQVITSKSILLVPHTDAILASVGHSYKYGEKCACTEQISLSAVLRHICIVLRSLK